MKAPARVHISTRDPVCAQSGFAAFPQNFSSPPPRPPDPFSEDSVSEVPSPPYLVCSPSSPPLGQPGRYCRRHLGSGRRGRGPRHGAEPLAGRRRGPAVPGLLARELVTCTAVKLAGVSEESQNPDLPLHLTVSLRAPLLTSEHSSSKPLFLSKAENQFLVRRTTSSPGRAEPFPKCLNGAPCSLVLLSIEVVTL